MNENGGALFKFNFAITATSIILLNLSFFLKDVSSPFIGPNLSVLGIFVSVLALIMIPYRHPKVVFFFCMAVVLLLLFCEARVGLLSFILGIIIGFLLKKSESAKRNFVKTEYLLIGFVIIGLVSAFLFKVKSTSGRWFIWKNSFNVAKEYLGTGTGLHKFRVYYNDQQANWFLENGTYNSEALLADTVYYAFNEWLQLAVEIGMPATILILVTIVVILYKAIQNVKVGISSKHNEQIIAAFSALFFSSFFSYPFYYLPTLFLFGILLLKVIQIADFDIFQKSNQKWYKFLSGASMLIFIGFLSLHIYARLQWKNANELVKVRFKRQALSKMNKAFFLLHGNGDYLYTLANIYESLGKNDSALMMIKSASLSKNDYLLNRKIGQLYFQDSNFTDAEKHFLKAVYMVPNRFVSRELLIDFYIRAGKDEEAVRWIKQTLNMPIKVKSQNVDRIRTRLNNYLENRLW